MKATIVSATDAVLFDLLLGLIQSIRACPESRDVEVCVLDVGMTPEQVSQLAPMVTRVVKAQWDFEFEGREVRPSWYKAMFARPCLPRYFPDYELLIWIDADAWLCNWDAMALLLAARETRGIVIVPELDRTYSYCFHKRSGVLDNVATTYRESFGDEAASKYTDMPILNAGVFAMRRDLPFWDIWAEILAEALRRRVRVLIEQCALNLGIYSGRIAADFLPSWCNWNVANSVPVLDPKTRRLFVPAMPYEPISICHLTDAKRETLSVLCTDRVFRNLPLTYEAVRLSDLGPVQA
jgi:hypothetical protein